MTKTKKIAFQGERGANSHIACLAAYSNYEPIACATFDEALNAVAASNADLAMIPIDNSIAGRVADIHHLLPKANLHIIGEYFLPIHFQLVAPKGATLSTIETVESHIHALGQCGRFINEHGYKPVTAADTAGAARHVAEANDTSRAALAHRLAGEIYGLDVLADNVEDAAHNTTRFVVLSREPRRLAPGGGPTITTFIFRVRNWPAALYKALGGFATNNINMTKLESYMLEGHFFATMFYADVEGHPDDPALKYALEELKFFSQEGSLKILGVYPASSHRTEYTEEKTD
jgi:prephenate dehydratase